MSESSVSEHVPGGTEATESSATTATTNDKTCCVIYAKLGAGQAAYAEFTARLERETDPQTLHIEGTPDREFMACWTQYLTQAQIDEYEKDKAISCALKFLSNL